MEPGQLANGADGEASAFEVPIELATATRRERVVHDGGFHISGGQGLASDLTSSNSITTNLRVSPSLIFANNSAPGFLPV
ncbi:hypothetical protein M407DRAFT_119871 [Tulasnella calospora MUT 4182]|uniref:Uncharacterized protein n=1 Tax=Tulasnella calospora MUT 4182 TaxID=1051891 RepID=A0A0C3KL83_9AGAM|nr:hypothetical protein M407DRAFT_119871 [Tulasnella calospora MUT 4182]